MAVWQGLEFEWLWVYHGDVPRVGLWSDEVTVPAGWFWVDRGLARIKSNGRLITVRSGESFFSAPGIRLQWFAAGTRLLSVGLRCKTKAGLPLFQDGLNVKLGEAASELLRKATQKLFRSVHGNKRLVSFQRASLQAARSLADWSDHEAAFRTWFCVYLRTLEKLSVLPITSRGIGDPRLERLLTALNDWPLHQPLSLASLAGQSAMGERRARDLLRARLGVTPQAWLQRRRLEFARRVLIVEATPVKEIAFRLGFRHAPHFTAWFKRATSFSPTAFRAAHRIDEAA